MKRFTVFFMMFFMLSAGAVFAKGQWTQVYHENDHPDKILTLYDVAYGSGKFVVVGASINNKQNIGNSYPYIMVSSDGSSWSDVTPQLNLNAGYLFDILYANGLFVAVGNDNTKTTNYNEEVLILTSADGLSWNQINHTGLPLYAFSNYIGYGNGRYVLAADSEVYYSDDLINWTKGSVPEFAYWKSIAYGNGIFSMVGSNSSFYAKRVVSSNGVSWSVADGDAVGSANVDFVNNSFINVGKSSGIDSSVDGQNWQEVTPKLMSVNTVHTVDFADGLYIFGGGSIQDGNSSGKIWGTTDLQTWWFEKINIEHEGGVTGIAHDGQYFIAVTYDKGMVYRASFSGLSNPNIPQLTTSSIVSGNVDEPLEYTISVSGMTPPYYFNKYNIEDGAKSYDMPEGLRLNTSTGVLSGTPTKKGSTALKISVREQDQSSVGSSELETLITIVIGDGTETCSPTSLLDCDEYHCKQYGGYWWNETCNTTPDPGDTCSSTSLSNCDEYHCNQYGGYWWNETCNTTPEPSLETQTIAGIEWLTEEPDGYFSWQEANKWCQDRSTRLPRMDELIAVWNASGQVISPFGFKKDTFYWSSEVADVANSHLGCAMDYDCSVAGVWEDNSIGHPKCVVRHNEQSTCDATLTTSLAMHIPVLELKSLFGNSTLLSVDLQYVVVQGSLDINFELSNYALISNVPIDCEAATLSADLSEMYLPRVILGDIAMSVILTYAPVGNRIIFKVVDYRILDN